MSNFDEQLKYRKKKEQEVFENAIDDIAASVIGKRLAAALSKGEVAENALTEVLSYFHIKYKSMSLPDDIGLDERFEYELRPLGIASRKITLDKGWYRNAFGPILGTLKEDGSAIALIPGKLSGYTMINLTTGRRIPVGRHNEGLINEDAYCFYKPLPLKALKIHDLLIFMLSQLSVSDIVLYILMMAITTAIGMISPKLTSLLFSDVLHSGSVSVLISLAVFMFSYTLCRLLVNVFQRMVEARVQTKVDITLEAAVMSRILSMPSGFFKKYASGELNSRANYVNTLCKTLISTIGNTGISALFSLVYIGQIFTFAPALVVPSVVVTLVTIIISVAVTIVQTKVTEKAMLLSSKTNGMTYSMISGVQKIKLAGAEKRMFSRWAKSYAAESAYTYNPPAFVKLGGTTNLAVSLLGSVLIYYCAINSGVSVSNYYAFNSAYGMVSGAFYAFAGIVSAIAMIKPSLDMAKPVLDTPPEVSEGKNIITELSGNIEINNIYFRYEENMPYVINGLSLKINAGDYVAIVGTTGCGKSTLMRLLLGFEKAEKGSIFFDNKDINSIDPYSLRRKIGSVMQDGKLFNSDIYSNIVISAPQLTLDDAWRAAEIAAIDEDIRQMPMGMQTMISEGQGGISGGQKQRLMIARAIAPGPRILLFDEATSALDNITQKKVSEAIDALNCTRIVIAHRLSTIRHCDRIIVLDKGDIAESGTYEELIAKNGLFAELVARQRIDEEELSA